MKLQISLIILFIAIFKDISTGLSLSLSKKHFVLVHGSCHGAWSWYKIVPLLKEHGHNVTAIELAASGVDLKPITDLKSISDYHRPLLEFMAGLPLQERVIIVGHSFGGLAIAQAMEKFHHKISAAVFVTALMPGPSLNISALTNKLTSTRGSLLNSHYTYDNGPKKAPTSLLFGPLYLSSIMYKLSPSEDVALASTLVRPTPLFDAEEESKNVMLTGESFGSIDRVFIIAEKDEVFTRDFQRWIIQENSPNEVVEILGSDHMVMMSKPFQLGDYLLKIATKY